MKKPIFFGTLLLILFSFPLIEAQKKNTVPQSQIIDAKELLRDLQILSADDMQGREPDTPGSRKAREYIVKRFKEAGLKPFNDSYLQAFQFSFGKVPNEKRQGTNIIGYIEGRQTPKKYVVVTAHYDHLGVKNGKLYNGADDNASGVAALFALAGYFNKYRPANSIIFVAFDAEESSREGGSANFLLSPPVKMEEIVMNINIDMIGRDKNDILYAVGTYHYPFLKPYLEKIALPARLKLLFAHDNPNDQKMEDWTADSDHIQFHRRKIPFIYFGVEDYEHHHQPTDDYETMTPEFYVHAVETIIAAVKEFDANLPQIEKQKAALSQN